MNLNNKWLLIPMLLLGMSLLPLGDSAGKFIMMEGESSIFVAWSRIVIGALFVLPFSGLKLSELPLFFNWGIILRALLFLGVISLIMQAIKTEPLANVFGAFFVGPILSYFLAALLLKEKISKVRSILLLVGFIGALLVIKPGFGMTQGIGFAVLAGCLYGTMLVLNRWLAITFRPRLVLVSSLIIGAIVMTPFAYSSFPSQLTSNLSWLVLMSAISSAIGNLLILQATRNLTAGIVAPFVYTQLIAATFFGYIFFAELPDSLSFLGLLILLLSGFASYFIAGRENK